MPAGQYVVRSVIAGASGQWSRVIAATSDYRYYATAGRASTASVLFRPSATVTGPRSRTVRSAASCVLTGTAVPGTKVLLHLHTTRMAAGDYSLVQTVTADAHGAWKREFRPTSDLALYAAREENLGPYVVYQLKIQR